MRTPVYRNLDQPFQIYGFSPIELVALSVAFVFFGEFAQSFSIHRIWALIFTFVFAFALYSFRRALGDLFLRRLVRFLSLPSLVRSKLVGSKHSVARGTS